MTTDAQDQSHRYNAALANRIEAKWQENWRERRTFAAPNPGQPGFDASKPKQYILDMFPFPSGAGLHVGHPRGYIATDVYARYLRMRGNNVLHTMGYDAFGLPAEQYAVETGAHPRDTTERNIAAIAGQLARLGLAHDPERVVATTDVPFYRWTQWIFLQIYDAWYDEERQTARPIAELVAQFESGARKVGGRDWAELDETERRKAVDGHRLAYIDEVPVNWCPALGTVLANEEVTAEGRSERGNHPVYRRPLRQWMMRITAYADRLLDGLNDLDWSDSLKTMQRNWIGRSEGARIRFALDGHEEEIEVFTTRPDTLFGATYMVLAPEHRLVEKIAATRQRSEVEEYVAWAAARDEGERAHADKKKTGVFTGAYALHPVTGEKLPVWIADYVMMGYGTGSIMAVPAHDQRDLDFARAFGLPVRAVLMPDEAWLKAHAPEGTEDAAACYVADPAAFREAFTGDGPLIQSAGDGISLDGLPMGEAKAKMTAWLEAQNRGGPKVQYKLRDWLFSRQRYWGEPIPILHGPDGEVRAVDESELPVKLPPMEDFRPSASDDPDAPPTPPLSRAPEEWRFVERDGETWARELNTMPQWAGSCWYYLRYLDPKNEEAFVAPEVERYWMCPPSGNEREGGVDLYVGGVEHAVLHLLYARFWHKVLYDLGHVSTPEPFHKLFNQGYILATAFTDERGVYVPASEVVDENGTPAEGAAPDSGRKFFWNGKPVTAESGKMGKSLKNGVTPDEICAQYGADTLRLYEMGMGPLSASQPWDPRDIVGSYRFLARVWRNLVDETTGTLRVSEEPPSEEIATALAQANDKVLADVERLAFHTAIARLIELNNRLTSLDAVPRKVAEGLVRMLAPFAPHIAEELWERLGHEGSVAFAAFPEPDSSLLVETRIELPVAVAGKVRAKLEVAPDAAQEEVERLALAEPGVERALAGRPVRKTIYVAGKMLNFVPG